MRKRVCKICGNLFFSDRHNKLTCSDICSYKNHRNLSSDWRNNNRQKTNSYSLKYYYADRENRMARRREYWSGYRDKNIERIREKNRISSKKYRQKPEVKMARKIIHQNKRHDKKFNFVKNDWLNILEKYRNHCAICGYLFPVEKLEIDHIVPFCLGGKLVSENIQPLCRSCNARKGKKIMKELQQVAEAYRNNKKPSI